MLLDYIGIPTMAYFETIFFASYKHKGQGRGSKLTKTHDSKKQGNWKRQFNARGGLQIKRGI